MRTPIARMGVARMGVAMVVVQVCWCTGGGARRVVRGWWCEGGGERVVVRGWWCEGGSPRRCCQGLLLPRLAADVCAQRGFGVAAHKLSNLRPRLSATPSRARFTSTSDSGHPSKTRAITPFHAVKSVSGIRWHGRAVAATAATSERIWSVETMLFDAFVPSFTTLPRSGATCRSSRSARPRPRRGVLNIIKMTDSETKPDCGFSQKMKPKVMSWFLEVKVRSQVLHFVTQYYV